MVPWEFWELGVGILEWEDMSFLTLKTEKSKIFNQDKLADS